MGTSRLRSDAQGLIGSGLTRRSVLLGAGATLAGPLAGCAETEIRDDFVTEIRVTDPGAAAINFEVKKRFPSAENLDRIAAALGIPPGELFVEESTAIDKMESVYELRGRLEKRLLDAVNEVFEKPAGE